MLVYVAISLSVYILLLLMLSRVATSILIIADPSVGAYYAKPSRKTPACQPLERCIYIPAFSRDYLPLFLPQI